MKRYRRPPKDLLRQLGLRGTVEDCTDVNEDVCWRLDIARVAERVSLLVSMVGPYSVVLRRMPTGAQVPLTRGTQGLSELEEFALDALASSGYDTLSEEEYKTRIDMNLIDVAPEYRCLYQALFCGEDYFPLH